MSTLSQDEIKVMRKTCQLAARTLEHVGKFVRPGITPLELDQIVYDFTLSHDARPAPLGYHGYPKSICTSVNDCICHGVPDDRPLKEGDIINVDVTTFKDGFHGDTSRTFFVGQVSDNAKRIVEVAEQAMWKGIDAVAPGATTGDIGFAVEKFVTRQGFFVVREIGGHGVGREFHEDPFVPSYGKKGRGHELPAWKTLTVEPMINETSAALVEKDIPDSTIKYYLTSDGTLSAQFEHTVLVTDTGVEVLTVP